MQGFDKVEDSVIHYNSQSFSILNKYMNNAELDASEC